MIFNKSNKFLRNKKSIGFVIADNLLCWKDITGLKKMFCLKKSEMKVKVLKVPNIFKSLDKLKLEIKQFKAVSVIDEFKSERPRLKSI